jgi:phosphopantothenoylcysteine decarboxylase/phosphopantothenate--cysteine ligase
MYATTMARISEADIYVGAAAISDYRPAAIAAQKIKKCGERLTLEMVRSPDLLAAIASLEKGPFTCGFAAETERLEEHARLKLDGKHLDMIIANQVGTELGFDEDDNSALVLWQGGGESFSRMSKAELARRLVAVIAARYRASKPSQLIPLRKPGGAA